MFWFLGFGVFFLIMSISLMFEEFSLGLFGLVFSFILLGVFLLLVWKQKPAFFHLLRERKFMAAIKVFAPPKKVSIAKQSSPTKSHRSTHFSLPKDYIIFDIETTGFSRTNDRIIEIAANKYHDGAIVQQYHTYVNPGVRISNGITRITGIKNTDVHDAPTIAEVKNDVLNFFGTSILVGHNINVFDLPFLQAQFSCEIRNPRIDTLHLARHVFPGLPSYKLTVLNEILELGNLQHHRAENDIIVNNELLLACATPAKYKKRVTDQSLLNSVHIERLSPYAKVDIHTITPSNPDKIPNTHLTGKSIAFSGELDMLPEEAYQIAVDAGAILKTAVSKKVDYLVLGVVDPRYLDECGHSSKERKAHELICSGESNISIIDESEFLSLAEPI